MEIDTIHWLGCTVCGRDSEFVAVPVDDGGDEAEVMCSRCGEARLMASLVNTGAVRVA